MEPYIIILALTSILCVLETIIFKAEFVSWFFKPSNEAAKLYKTLLELEAEKRSINIVDEFPRFARLQRQINSLKDEMDLLGKDIKEKKNKWKVMVSVGFYSFKYIFYLYIIWKFYSTTIAKIPENWLYPFARILPQSIKSGQISVIPWLLLSEEASRTLSKAIFSSIFK